MPRMARIVISGYPFHLIHRGNNKQNVFMSDTDRRNYLYWMEEASKKYGMQIVAYCLMENHVHYIAFAEIDMSFARTINSAHMKYTQYFNQKYGKVGHLWQGRYYSCLLDEGHLIAAVRYVERNPVRANVVFKPWDWIWSSAREHMNMEKNGILSLSDLSKYMLIASWKDYLDIEDRREELFEIRRQTNSCKAWADDETKTFIEKQYGVRLMLNNRGRPFKKGDVK